MPNKVKIKRAIGLGTEEKLVLKAKLEKKHWSFTWGVSGRKKEVGVVYISTTRTKNAGGGEDEVFSDHTEEKLKFRSL